MAGGSITELLLLRAAQTARGITDQGVGPFTIPNEITESFGGSVANGWSTIDSTTIGATGWNLLTGLAATAAETGGWGNQTPAQGGALTRMGAGVSLVNSEQLVRFRMSGANPASATWQSYIFARYQGSSDYYRVVFSLLTSGILQAKIQRNTTAGGAADVGGAFQTVDAAYAALRVYWCRFQVNGNVLRARWWLDGTGEPGTWNVDTTDGTISTAGDLVLGSFAGAASGAVTVGFDDYSALDPAAGGGTDSVGIALPVQRRITDTGVTPEAYAIDAAGRTVSNDWGKPDTGSQPAWVNLQGAGTTQSVNGTDLLLTSVGTTSAQATSVGLGLNVADVDILVRAKANDASPNVNVDVQVFGRWVSSSSFVRAGFRILPTGDIQARIDEVVSGTANTLDALTISAYTANTYYWIRFVVVGSNYYLKVWKDGTTEPAFQPTVNNDQLTADSYTGWVNLGVLTNTGEAGFRDLVTANYTGTFIASFDSVRIARPGWDSVAATFHAGSVSTSRSVTDTGATISDSIQRAVVRLVSDTGATISDSVARVAAHPRAVTDTGVTNTDSVGPRAMNRVVADTGATISDSVTRVASRPRVVTDTGVSQSDAVGTLRSRAVTDTGATITDSIKRAIVRLVSDTGVTITDSVTGLRGFLRLVSDTGTTTTDAIGRAIVRQVTDTGVTQSDSVGAQTGHLRPITDTGTTISDALATNRGRPIQDTGTTITDSVTRLATHPRPITDTGATITDSVSSNRGRPITDTGTTITDSVATLKGFLRPVTDTGASISDTLATSRNRLVTDTGTTITDSVARAATHPRVVTDTGATISDSVATQLGRLRPVTDQGATITDSVAIRLARQRPVSDTGATISDAVGRAVVRLVTDTGVTLTDTVVGQHGALRSVSDTGTTITDSVSAARNRVRAVTDTGATITDSVVRLLAATRAITDTGVTISDSVAVARGRPKSVTDTGATITDAVASMRNRMISDTGSSISDSIQRAINRRVTDTGLTQTDSVGTGGQTQRNITDTGTTISDSLRLATVRQVTDQGATISDSVASAAAHPRLVTDTGATITDSVVRTPNRVRSVTDTGATITDSLRRAIVRLISDTGATITDSVSVATRRFVYDWAFTTPDVFNTFEGGVNGTSISTANSGGASGVAITTTAGTAPKYSNAQAKTGLLSLLADTGAGAAAANAGYLGYSLTGDQWFRGYFYVPAAPVTTNTVIAALFASDATRSVAIRLFNGTNAWSLVNSSGTVYTGCSGTVPMPTGQWVRFDVKVNPTTGTAEAWMFAGALLENPIGAPATDHVSGTGLTISGTGTMASVRYGAVGVVAANFQVYVDEITGLSTTTWQGPSGMSDKVAGGKAYSRAITDTGATISDTVHAYASRRTVTDQGTTITDSVAFTQRLFRTVSDVGVSQSDSVAGGGAGSRLVTDTGVSQSDSVRRTVGRYITDQGATITDTVNRYTAILRTVSDQGATILDTVNSSSTRLRPVTDTGTAISDSVTRQRVVPRTITDQGSSITDNVTRPFVVHRIFDDGTTITDSVVARRVRPNPVVQVEMTLRAAGGSIEITTTVEPISSTSTAAGTLILTTRRPGAGHLGAQKVGDMTLEDS